jgi:hypothetical protein
MSKLVGVVVMMHPLQGSPSPNEAKTWDVKLLHFPARHLAICRDAGSRFLLNTYIEVASFYSVAT